MDIQRILDDIQEQSLVKVWSYKRLTLTVECIDDSFGGYYQVNLIQDMDDDDSELVLMNKEYSKADAYEILQSFLEGFWGNGGSLFQEVE